MKFASILDEELLLENVPGNTKKEVYTAMLQRLAEYAELELDVAALVEEMIAHETATGILMPKMRMPHLRCENLPDLFTVIGLPANREALGENIIIMSLIGNNMSDIYLKMLSSLARHLTKGEQVKAFLDASVKGKAALWEYLQKSDMSLRSVVTAEDVMSPVVEVIREDAPLSRAFDIFSSCHHRFLPVVDAAGKLKGELSARTILKRFFPDYVFMMENLNFLNDFAVFNEIFSSEHSLPVAQYMTEAASATLDTPLIQLTLQLAKQPAGDVYIVDNDGILKGIFSVDNVISKVLRG